MGYIHQDRPGPQCACRHPAGRKSGVRGNCGNSSSNWEQLGKSWNEVRMGGGGGRRGRGGGGGGGGVGGVGGGLGGPISVYKLPKPLVIE